MQFVAAVQVPSAPPARTPGTPCVRAHDIMCKNTRARLPQVAFATGMS
jgi:hypothetical protein